MALKVGSLYVSLGAETSGLLKGMGEALKSVEKVTAAVRKVSSGVAQTSAALTAMAGAAVHLAATVDGPTKAALINLGETLYLDLRDAGIGVSLVNPGFVETPLTAQNEFRMPALITPTVAIPLFARSADNLRDHRHVTSLLHRIRLTPHGVTVTPTMSFDERGHTFSVPQMPSGITGAPDSCARRAAPHRPRRIGL